VQINLVLAWLWITLGFVSGSLFGFNFNFLREDWLGGYSSNIRRLYRLGHISFFGLGVINLMFYITIRTLGMESALTVIASWAMVIGGMSMPICCFITAHYPKLKDFFYIPVISLIIGGLLTLWQVVHA